MLSLLVARVTQEVLASGRYPPLLKVLSGCADEEERDRSCQTKRRVNGAGIDLLFGGADADVEQWDDTVLKVKTAFSSAKIVVPGHGSEGGLDLLDHTIDLVKTELRNPNNE